MRHVVLIGVLVLAALRGPAAAQELPRDPYAPTPPSAPGGPGDPYAPAPPGAVAPVPGVPGVPGVNVPPDAVDPAAPPPAQMAPAPAPVAPGPSAEEARAEYERRAIGIHPDTLSFAVAGFNQAIVTSRFAYRGSVQQVFPDVPAFLDAVGETQRAEEYRSRSRLRLALMIPGAIVAAVGAGITAWAVYEGDQPVHVCQPGDNACQTVLDKRGIDNATMGAGIGLFVGGVVVAIIGGRISRPDLTVSEAMSLTDAYNRRLRRELGLAAAAPPRISLVPSFGPHGGGLSFSARF